MARPGIALATTLILYLGGASEVRAQMSYEEGMARQRAAHHAQMMEQGRQLAEGGGGFESAPTGGGQGYVAQMRALGIALEAPPPPEPPVEPAGGDVVHRSANAVWLLFKASQTRGQGCTAIYSRGRNMLILAGPNGAMPGSITFIGERIPAASEVRETRVSLSADGRPVDIRALHAPVQGGTVLMAPAVIEDTLPSIGDSEVLSVHLDGQTVYEVRTEGSFKARDALRECLAGNR